MNYWKIGQTPYSWNPLSETLDWSGTDSPTNFNKNKNRDDWTNVQISYKYNAAGFRTYDLVKLAGQKVNIALGCSITEGIGLPAEQTWPSLIEQKLDYPVLNLGLGGGTTDTVARILTNISTVYDIQTVLIMWPFVHRFEIYCPQNSKLKIHTILPQNSNLEHQWALADTMGIQRFNQNQLIVNLLAKKYKFNINQHLAVDILDKIDHKTKGIRARDGMHPGTNMQIKIADMILST